MNDRERRIAALTAEAQHWATQRSLDPYDRTARENLARALLELQGDRFPLGSVARGQHLLALMGDAFPIAALRRAYFENLERLLAGRTPLAEAGQVVLGLGSGRCGSTSLTAILSTVDASCCTHENPPLIYWQPLDEQVQFHFKRFSLLARSFALVFDASHWWLNAVDAFFARFPTGKVVALRRDTEACARSFLERKALGRGSINHWAPPRNGIWRSNIWDPVYPTYPLPAGAEEDPDAAKLDAIRRYVGEYNARLAELAAQRPQSVMLVRTEDLGESDVQQRIFAFIGKAGKPSPRLLNAGTVADGLETFRF